MLGSLVGSSIKSRKWSDNKKEPQVEAVLRRNLRVAVRVGGATRKFRCAPLAALCFTRYQSRNL